MKLIVTGGGTGGHIYPALEVAKLARTHGANVRYFGSLRGQEGRASENAGFAFSGFPSQPLYSMISIRGLKSLAKLLKAKSMATREMKSDRPDFVFSTGGYAAGPVVAAAKALGVPYLIHEGNSVPGRSNLMFAKDAKAFTTLFQSTSRYAHGVKCTRVGQPIRRELREAVSGRGPEPDFVLCLGGSQGSEFLNGCVPRAFAGDTLSTARLLIASGPKNFEVTSKIVESLGIGNRVQVRPYLDSGELVDAYQRAAVIVARSGSTLAEIAMFGIPSVLVPLPTSAGDHQLHNAEEFVEMDAAHLLPQSDATPAALAESIAEWLHNPDRMEASAKALREWDLPGATETIFKLMEQSPAA